MLETWSNRIEKFIKYIHFEVKMDEIMKDLKGWREKFGISQKKLADLAEVSLTTVRHFEMGKQKPQKQTIERIAEALKSFEGVKPRLDKRKRGPKPGRSRTITVATAAQESPGTGKRRGRPPKVVEIPTPVPVKADKNMPIKLSNIDLELINRILNMSGKQKLDLLKTLM